MLDLRSFLGRFPPGNDSVARIVRLRLGAGGQHGFIDIRDVTA
jgi:hypothetical protein